MTPDQIVGWAITLAALVVLIVTTVRNGRATTRVEYAAAVVEDAANTARAAANAAFYDRQGVKR